MRLPFQRKSHEQAARAEEALAEAKRDLEATKKKTPGIKDLGNRVIARKQHNGIGAALTLSFTREPR